MVGYPALYSALMAIKTEFNPSIDYGTSITVAESQITPANGTWMVSKINLELESNTPHGRWFSTYLCVIPNQATNA
jgi:hypothetical protein